MLDTAVGVRPWQFPQRKNAPRQTGQWPGMRVREPGWAATTCSSTAELHCVQVRCHDGGHHERHHLGLFETEVCVRVCVGVLAEWWPCVATGNRDVVLCVTMIRTASRQKPIRRHAVRVSKLQRPSLFGLDVSVGLCSHAPCRRSAAVWTPWPMGTQGKTETARWLGLAVNNRAEGLSFGMGGLTGGLDEGRSLVAGRGWCRQ